MVRSTRTEEGGRRISVLVRRMVVVEFQYSYGGWPLFALLSRAHSAYRFMLTTEHTFRRRHEGIHPECPKESNYPEGHPCDADANNPGNHGICHSGVCSHLHAAWCTNLGGDAESSCSVPGYECVRSCLSQKDESVGCLFGVLGCAQNNREMLTAFSEFNKWDEGGVYYIHGGSTCEIAAAGTPCVVGITQENGLCEASGSCNACEEKSGCGVEYAGDEITTVTTTLTTATSTTTTTTTTTATTTTTTTTATVTSVTATTTITTTTTTTTTVVSSSVATTRRRASTTASQVGASRTTKISSITPNQNAGPGPSLSMQSTRPPSNQSSAANNNNSNLTVGAGSNTTVDEEVADGSSSGKSKLGAGVIFLIVLLVLAACGALLYYLARHDSAYLTRICNSCTRQNDRNKSANSRSDGDDGGSGGGYAGGTIDMMLNPMHTTAPRDAALSHGEQQVEAIDQVEQGSDTSGTAAAAADGYLANDTVNVPVVAGRGGGVSAMAGAAASAGAFVKPKRHTYINVVENLDNSVGGIGLAATTTAVAVAVATPANAAAIADAIAKPKRRTYINVDDDLDGGIATTTTATADAGSVSAAAGAQTTNSKRHKYVNMNTFINTESGGLTYSIPLLQNSNSTPAGGAQQQQQQQQQQQRSRVLTFSGRDNQQTDASLI